MLAVVHCCGGISAQRKTFISQNIRMMISRSISKISIITKKQIFWKTKLEIFNFFNVKGCVWLDVLHSYLLRTMLVCMVVCSKVGVKVTRQMPSTSGHAMSLSDTDLTPSLIVLENKT